MTNTNNVAELISLTSAITGKAPAPIRGEFVFIEQDDATEFFNLPSNCFWQVMDSKEGDFGPVYFIHSVLNGQEWGKWVAAELLEEI
jgi:hypothetical protein